MHFRAAVAAAFIVSIASLIAGCVSQDYVGESFPATDSVRVFFSEGDVHRPFEVMGKDRAEAPDALTSEQIVAAMVKEAKEKGADAIIIDNVTTVKVGESTTSSGTEQTEEEYYMNSKGELKTHHAPTGTYSQASYTSDQRDKVITGRFIKFKD